MVVEVYERVSYVCHVHFNIRMMICVVDQSMPINCIGNSHIIITLYIYKSVNINGTDINDQIIAIFTYLIIGVLK